MKAAKTVLALGLVSLAGALAYRSCDTDVVPTPAQWAPTEVAAPPAPGSVAVERQARNAAAGDSAQVSHTRPAVVAVVDAATAAPLVGSSVFVEAGPQAGQAAYTTDADGCAEVRIPRAGGFAIRAELAGYSPSVLRRDAAPAEGGESALRLSLAASSWVDVNVVDQKGMPIANAVITAISGNGAFARSSAPTSVQGVVRLPLPQGSYTVDLESPWFPVAVEPAPRFRRVSVPGPPVTVTASELVAYAAEIDGDECISGHYQVGLSGFSLAAGLRPGSRSASGSCRPGGRAPPWRPSFRRRTG